MKLGEMTRPDVKPWIRTNKFPSTPLSHSNSTGPHQLFLTDTMETEEVIARLERRLLDAVADSLAEVVRDIQSGK